MTTLHGLEINVGDSVWFTRLGWGKVIDINERAPEPIRVMFSTPKIEISFSFDEKGRWTPVDEFPSLFWQEQTFDLTKPPAPVIKWRWVYGWEGSIQITELFYTEEEAEANQWSGNWDWKQKIDQTRREE